MNSLDLITRWKLDGIRWPVKRQYETLSTCCAHPNPIVLSILNYFRFSWISISIRCWTTWIFFFVCFHIILSSLVDSLMSNARLKFKKWNERQMGLAKWRRTVQTVKPSWGQSMEIIWSIFQAHLSKNKWKFHNSHPKVRCECCLYSANAIALGISNFESLLIAN